MKVYDCIPFFDELDILEIRKGLMYIMEGYSHVTIKSIIQAYLEPILDLQFSVFRSA